jgi:RNA 3'-terminal phosphate cyclase (ATP)
MVLNGSHGEGGGALLRTALAVAALTQQPVRIHNVRGGMRTPGINSEDLCFIRALGLSCLASMQGDDLGSNDLTFVPSRAPRSLNHRLDITEFEKGTVPGNALIVAHALLPVLARAGAYSRLIVHGETYNPNTLSFDAFERVTLAAHRRQGLYAYPNHVMAGFGYGARGEIGFEIEPSALQGLDWAARGALRRIGAVIATAELQESVGQRGVAHVERLFGGEPFETRHGRREVLPNLEVEAEAIEVRSRGPGAFVTVWAEFEQGFGHGTAMGARGVKIETVVEHAIDAFLPWFKSEATVDPFLADQILLPAAIAESPTTYTTSRVTQRLITMAWVIKQFLPIHITVFGRDGEPGKVTISR